MKITEPAALAILQAMKKSNLDTSEVAVSFEFVNGGVGFSFRNDVFGKEYQFHGLRVLVDERIDTEKMIIDLSESNGRTGLIFTGEQDDSIIDRKSS